MDYYNEGTLRGEIPANLRKKNIKNTTDSIDELNGRSAVIDISKFNKLEDGLYMQKLKEFCQQVENYKERIIYIPVAKWNRIAQGDIMRSKTPLGAICRYIKQSPVAFKKDFTGVMFLFYNENHESFALYPDQYKGSEFNTFMNCIQVLTTSHATHYLTGIETEKSPVKDVSNMKEREKKKLKRRSKIL